MNVAIAWRTARLYAIAHNRSIWLHYETKYLCMFISCRCQCCGIWRCEEAACCTEASVHRQAVVLVAVNSCQWGVTSCMIKRAPRAADWGSHDYVTVTEPGSDTAKHITFTVLEVSIVFFALSAVVQLHALCTKLAYDLAPRRIAESLDELVDCRTFQTGTDH